MPRKKYSEFSPEQKQKTRAAARRWSVKNRDRVRANNLVWRAKNAKRISDKQHNDLLVKKYGITAEDKRDRISAQGGRCAVCGSSNPGGMWGTFNTDHCHETGVVRGELCVRCNKGLGFFSDDPGILRAAAAYLEIFQNGA